MDYAFAPDSSNPKDPVPAALRTMFGRRANTKVVSGKKILTVRDFVTELNTLPVTDRPIGNAFIGSHANSEGQMFVPLFPGQADPRKTSYETLEESIGSATKSVKIDDTTIGWTAGAPIDHAVHFKGCNLGQAQPYLDKFKHALGGHVILTAPRHFHGVTPEAKGSFEFMCYEFSVRAPADFPTRAALIAALAGAGFKNIHGAAVPVADLEAVVPKPDITKTKKWQVRVKLGATVGGTTTILVPQQFRVERIPLVRRIGYATEADIPASKADRESALDASLAGDPLFASGHAFPKYERVGYASLADLIAGYTWSFKKDFSKKLGHMLVCTGNRTEYTVVTPVLGTTGNLIFNFHPDPASGLAAVTTGVVETDTRLFAKAA